MHEAAALADRVAIIDRGKLLALDTPAALVQSLPGHETLELTVGPVDGGGAEGVLTALRSLPRVEAVEPLRAPQNGPGGGPFAGDDGREAAPARELRIRLYVEGDAPALVAPAATALAERGLGITDISLGRPDLEDVFIHLTGRALR